jgi:hypothetical protein
MSYYSLARSRPSAHFHYQHDPSPPPPPAPALLPRRRCPPPTRNHRPPSHRTPSRRRSLRRRPASLAPPQPRPCAACTATTPPPSAARVSPHQRLLLRTHCTSTVPPPTCIAPLLCIHAAHATCSAFCPSSQRRVLVTHCVVMGRDKRKGKEVVVEEPARKRTHAAREAERAEMVAKAAEEQASGRAHPFAIWDTPARGRGRGRGMGRVRGARATEPQQQQQQQSQISHIQRQSRIQIQSSPSSLRGRIHRSHRFHDALAAFGRRPQQVTLHQRPSVALDRGREEVTSHRSLAGPP